MKWVRAFFLAIGLLMTAIGVWGTIEESTSPSEQLILPIGFLITGSVVCFALFWFANRAQPSEAERSPSLEYPPFLASYLLSSLLCLFLLVLAVADLISALTDSARLSRFSATTEIVKTTTPVIPGLVLSTYAPAPTIYFVVDGVTYETKGNNIAGNAEKRIHKVYYNPDNPNENYVGLIHTEYSFGGAGIAFVLSVAIGATIAWVSRRNSRAGSDSVVAVTSRKKAILLAMLSAVCALAMFLGCAGMLDITANRHDQFQRDFSVTLLIFGGGSLIIAPVFLIEKRLMTS